MATLEQLRAILPGGSKLSDEDVISQVSNLVGWHPQDVAEHLGMETGKERGAFSAGLRSGYEDIKGIGYSAGGALSDVVGAKSAKSWFDRQAKNKEVASQIESRPDLENIENQTLGSLPSYAAYQLSKQGAQVGAAIGAGLLVPEAAVPAALSRGAAAIPRALGGGGLGAAETFAAQKAALRTGQTVAKGLVGGAAVNEVNAIGSLYQNANENPEDTHPGLTAVGLSVPYAIAETAPEALLLGRLGGHGGFEGNFLKRTAKSAGVQSLTGATSELAQGELEMAVGKPLTDEEKFSQRLNAGVAGGLVEGLFGAAGGFKNGTATPLMKGTNEQGPTSSLAQGNGQAGGKQPNTGDSVQQAFNDNVDIGTTPTAKVPLPTASATQQGTTDVAQQAAAAQQQQQQAQAVQQQQQAAAQAQADQKTRQDQALQTFGVANSVDDTRGNLVGKPILSKSTLSVVADALEKEHNAMPEDQRTIASAIIAANNALATPEKTNPLVSFSFNVADPAKTATSVQNAFKAIANVATKYQIHDATSAEEAAARLDEQSKSAKAGELDKINAIHQALTGKDTSGFIASQQSKGEKNGNKQPQRQVEATPRVGTVPVQGGSAQAANGGGNVGNGNVQPIGAGSVPQEQTGQQTGQLSGEGIRNSPSGTLPSGNVHNDGNGVGQGQINEQAATTSGESQQPSVQAVAKPTVAEGKGARVYDPTISYYATDLSHIKPARREEIRNDLIRAILAPKVERVGVMTLAQRVDMVTMALIDGEPQEDIAKQLGVSEDAVQKQLERLGIVVKPRLTPAQQGEINSIEQRLGIPAGTRNTTKDPFAVSKAITAQLPVEETADLVHRLDGLYKSASKDYGIETPKDGKAFDDMLLDAGEAYRSAEFPDGIGAGEIVYLYSHDKNVTTEQSLADELENGSVSGDRSKLLAEEMRGRGEGNEGQSMGVISQAGGSQGSVESLNKAFFDRIEKLTKEMEALPPKDPRRATLEAKIKDEWAKYGEKQGALAKQGELEVNQTEEGEEENAVQEQSANEGNVRKSTRGGKKVGEANAKPEKSARKSTKQETNKEPVEPKEVKSDNELAGEAWDKVASEYPEAPKWADLTKEQQKTFTDFGPKNWTAQDVQGELVKLAKKQFGENTTKGVKNPYSVAELTDEIKTFIRADILGRKLKIVENVQQLLLSPDREEQIVGAAMGVNGAYGVATNGTAYLIANRIEKGTGRAKFMHEVGAHLGLEKLLPTAIYNKLTEQIASWAKSDNGSVESTLAVKAAERVMNANTPKEDQRSEMLAYFIEEAMQAGIDPTAAGKESAALSSWFRTLWAAFKNAVRKLGFKESNLTAQDVVNLAFGAARLEITGTWHGTAASFRKFNHKFMGSGEGAQAYGWGTYLAQRVGIAHGYWKADVQRKTSPVEVLYNGKDIDHIATDLFFKSNLTKDEKALLNIVTELSLQAGVGNTDSIRTVHLNLAKKLNKTAEEKYASEWLDKHYSDFSTKSTAPLGSLLRVDVGVGQNDLLDWDEPLSRQPNVLKAIKNNLSSDVISTLEEEYNDDLDNLTGEDFYRGLQALEKRDGLISDQFKDVEDYNKRLGNKGAKQIVSTYLDEIAKVPGIKFLDAMSRGAGPEKKLVFHGVKYTSDELRHLVKEAREGKGTLTLDQVTNLRHVLHVGINAALEEYKKKIQRTIDSSVQIYKESSERFKVPYNEAEALARAKATAEKTYEAQQLKWLEDNLKNIDVISKEKVRTKNLVVFNDKNIQRVGSEIAADRQRMKFGVDQATVDKNINKLPPRIQKPTRVITDSLFKQVISKMGAAKNLILKSAITEDVVKYAQKYMRSADKYLAAQYARQAMVNKFNNKVDKILTAYEKLDKVIQGEGAGSVNEFIADSTLSGKWGYYPGAKFVGTKLFEVDPDMEKRFKAFEKYEGAQELIKSVFEHGHDVLMAKQAAATKAVDAEFAERERQAFFDPDILDQLRAEKKAAIAKISLGDPTVPYAPLSRYGDYVVIAKSAEYQAYEDMLSGERGMATGNNDIVGDANRARIWMDENQSNSTHYVVQFAETLGEANKIAQDLGATGLYDNVQSGEKETQASYAGGSDIHLAVARLRNLFKRSTENKNTPEAKALDKMIGDLYLLATAENSARKSEIERKKISGFDKNMMRNLATSGKANAHFLASMEHNDAINESIDEMRQQAKANRAEAMPYFNELMERNAASMNYKSPSIIAKSLNQANHIYSLTFSPAFYLQQMVQTAAISLPYLAGRLGYTNAAKHIGRAYQDVSKIKNALDFKNANDHLDFSKAPADVRAMLDRLVGMGKIDIGMDSEFKAKGYDQTLFDKVMYKMQGITNRIEAVNRSVAAIAAYRGYLERYGMDKVEGATQYAADVVSDTHGSYDGFNTPRVLQSTFGKVALQFRRFQIIQLSMMAKMIHTAFIENSASKEEKLVAKKTLAFICAQMAVVAGGLGVPFVSQLAFLMLKMFGSPDEPDDVEYKLRKLIGDPVAAELLLRGVSGAVGWESFGKKISMENVASPFGGYVVPDLTNRKGVEKTALAILGPSLSLTEKLADAFQFATQGNYYKGLEAALPNGLSNSLKGARYLTEGMTMRNGDLVMKPDDVGMLGAASQMFGLPTNAITHQQFAQKVKAEYDQQYQERLTEIKGEYVKAYRANDSKGMSNAREEFRQMEESRMANGYKRQPLSELLKAPMAAMKRERSVVNGVESTKQNKQFLATMGA